VAAVASAANATSVTYVGSQGDLGAQVTFYQASPGQDLVVTLQNTGSAAEVPADVLTAVFFGMSDPDPVLTNKVSAVLGTGSTVWEGGTDITSTVAGGVVGGEWAFKQGFSKTFTAGTVSGTPTYGISSAGFSGTPSFGKNDRFPGDNLDPPDNGAPDGLNYGIVSSIGAGANSEVRGEPLVKDTVVFTLGVPTGFDLDGKVSDVWFQYGTGWSEPSFPGYGSGGGPPVPEPVTLAGVLLAVGGLGRYVRRRLR